MTRIENRPTRSTYHASDLRSRQSSTPFAQQPRRPAPRRSGGGNGLGRWAVRALVALAYLAVVTFVTLGPVPWQSQTYEGVPEGILNPEAWRGLDWEWGNREFLLNVVMFLPAAAAFAWLLRGGAVTGLLWALVFTITIETLQLFQPERVSDPRDLLSNATGALVGAAAFALLRLMKRIAS